MAARPVRTVNDDPQDDALGAGRDLAAMRNDLGALYDPHAATLEKDFQSEEDELNAVLAEAGGSEGAGSVVIRKMGDKTRKFEWLTKYTVAEFVAIGGVANLASKFGGGEYELIVYGADNRIVKRPKVTVSAAAVAELKASESGQAGFDKLAAVMLEGFKQIAVMLQSQQRPQESREAWLRELVMMRDVFGANKQPDTLDTLAKFIPAMRSLMPRGEGETNLLDVMSELAREFGPAIRDAVSKTPALANPSAMVPGRPGIGNLPGTAPGNGAANLSPEQIGANQMQIALRAQLAYLCGEAERDTDPAPYAAIICDKVSGEVLSGWVNNPDWLDELAKVHAGVKLFPKWFNELRDAVVEILTEPDQPGVTDGGDDAEDLAP